MWKSVVPRSCHFQIFPIDERNEEKYFSRGIGWVVSLTTFKNVKNVHSDFTFFYENAFFKQVNWHLVFLEPFWQFLYLPTTQNSINSSKQIVLPKKKWPGWPFYSVFSLHQPVKVWSRMLKGKKNMFMEKISEIYFVHACPS